MSATCRRHDTECRRLGKKTTRRHPTCGAKIIFTSMARCVREGKRMSMGIIQGRCKTFELLSLASFTLEPANSQQRTLRPHELELVSLEKGKKRHLTEGIAEETLTDLTVLVGKWDFPSLPVEAPTPSITTIQQLGLGIAHAFNSQTSPAFDHLSSTCRRHVGDMSATSPNVAKSWPTLRVVATRKSPRHTQFSSITADKYKSVQTYELATLP